MVSGLGREIPSPNGQAIRGAIQTDTAINAGKLCELLQFVLEFHTTLYRKTEVCGLSLILTSQCKEKEQDIP